MYQIEFAVTLSTIFRKMTESISKQIFNDEIINYILSYIVKVISIGDENVK